MTELAPQPMRRAASLSEQPESTKAKARRRRSSSRSPLPFGLGIGVQAEKQSTYILYTWLNKRVGKRVRSNVPTSDLLWLSTSEIRASSANTRPTRAS